MTTIVKAANAAQFLSLVPHLLGFTPSRSLVLVPFEGGRSLGAMRFDLPGASPDTPPDTIDRIASTVIGMVCRLPTATAVAAVAYTDSTFAADAAMPHQDLLRALERRADSCGVHVTDMICVAPDAWGSLFDIECPGEGRPLAEIDVNADAETGPAPVGNQTAGAALPPVDSVQREHVAEAIVSLKHLVELLSGTCDGDAAPEVRQRINPQTIAAAYTLDDIPALFEESLTWNVADLAPYDVALVGWCLARPSMRDVALVQWSGQFDDGDEALDAQLRWETGEEYPPDLAMRMWGEGERPDPGRLHAGLELSRRIAAAVPREMRAGPLSMCAWLSWALGRSSHAEVYASMACEIEPEHGLSEIVLSFVAAGHLPEWAFTATPPPS
ncbi:DUF4192 family protein [Microbacterium sp. NPDC076911]|uniref:DUF4192 family protein n=1 Tax=Microbacterium sp. NPDC076911 TaxID=3154958 RepID=UPI00341A338C